ncbi:MULTISPECIES: biotin-dependent carboxyltransferase family protein [Pseudomonas]|uniref:5-oxoprolinase/urea amidolyase family protein n=6 Tax=Pseudomonas TaxID=286 RepID=A0AAJ4E558_PSESX|nr:MULTISPECIES: biotin-dependent carboxyltransferase family protein [Pseudomonas]MCW6056316.1 biotin-dependent carboxyltransferase family protein [Pseudomonas fragi]AAY37759.1 Urea amidolyase-related protein [Pseudomonas syringae pv. syringae B728a]KWS09729.1 allophanate hydrolase [Pseudomonas syringae pv. syringae]KWS25834.1 allophanate hydrolase [Pseudomonas syringae pv. syringae]KWS27249.1 allophanate hydrolase [Pseudomonas syringae pv. syringae]
MIKVLKPGLATSVQDLGREGYYHLGIPPSGALDQYALSAANQLVGNPPGAAGLECTLLGPELEFQCDTLAAVCGAHMAARLDGVEMHHDTAFAVKAGQVLRFDFPKDGARTYLAVAGGIDVPLVLGSRSTYTLGALGGFQGRRLAADDQLPIGTPSGKGRAGASLPMALRQSLGGEVYLRVVPGLYYERLTEFAATSFFSEPWSVGSEADRIGYRFKGGRALTFQPREQPFGAGSDPSNIVDSCYPIGSIQVPAGLEPIVLHRDAVSGGGYAMIGTVISADLDLIGQMQPNQTARFVAVTLEEALEARKSYKKKLACLSKLFPS